jgi:hypothetical protein
LRVDLNCNKGANHRLWLSGFRQERGAQPVEGGLRRADDNSLTVAVKLESWLRSSFLGDTYQTVPTSLSGSAQGTAMPVTLRPILAPVRSLIPRDISGRSRLTAP